MLWDFSLENYGNVWSLIIQLTLLLVFLVVGNIVRRSIPFLKKSYIPSALIGGLLLALVNVGVNAIVKKTSGNDYNFIDKDIMKVVTYHALAIGFIATTLKVSQRENRKAIGTLSIQNGLITGSTYMLQAAFGILTVLIFYWAGKTIFYDAGVILPLGFGQGPGNALTWDMNFSNPEHMSKIGAEGLMDTNGDFGLAIASIGFIVASVVGVVYLNIFKRKGEIIRSEVEYSRTVEEFFEHNEIGDNDSVDKMSIQVGIVAICYLMTFGIMAALSFSDFTSSIAWGFNFIFGVISATFVKFLIKLFKKKGIFKHKYINNYQMDRISGFAFDLMIIAGVAAIDINSIKGYIGVIIVLSIVGTIITYIYVRLITKFCFKGLEHQMFLVNFGTLTGTASNGMILLREVDPTYQTQACNIFVVSQFPAMVAVAPLLLLLNFTAKSLTTTYISLAIFLVLAIVYTLVIIFLSRKYKARTAKSN